MFDKSYPFTYLGERVTMLADPGRKVLYRFDAKRRRYQVSFEFFSIEIVAVKYCAMADRNASNRYEKIFNDGDGFRVISTCLHIMLDFLKRNPDTHLAFYAVPRKWQEQIMANKRPMKAQQKKMFIGQYRSTRFTLYNYAMLNLFPSTKFVHVRDEQNAIYLLLNKNLRQHRIRVKQMGQFLFKNYDMVFAIADDSIN